MNLIIGGAYQGKKEYAQKTYGIEEAQIWQGGYPVPEGEWRCINGLHKVVKQMLENAAGRQTYQDILSYIRQFASKIPNVILICDEIGLGIIPLNKSEREYRECVGRILCELAREADTVERVHCSVGQVIKHTVYISIIRHGSTEGNLQGRYEGITDKPLCEAGKKELMRRLEKRNMCGGGRIIPPAEAVITSPLKRCQETAQLLYPEITPVIIKDFRETDFGLFEGKNYEELMADENLAPLYQAWIDAVGKAPFPEGESPEQMKMRCVKAFGKLLPMLANHAHTAMILHGGTMMSILSAFVTPRQDYYDFQCENGAGYLCRLELTGDGQLYQMKCIGSFA